ncbi:unnamed protein product [Dibothriocephalus latus]|uniref:Myosin tail domain-containing protein n=1 Tax=Dibothriocephalus latus TaxID=60516 RepID=A0A3P7LYV3_DIBLA|nr:unnamed protein product [Dibothriocephalus latus]
MDAELTETRQRAEVADRQRDEFSKQLKRLQLLSMDLKRELDASMKARDDALTAARDLEKRLRATESERAQAVEDLAASERTCRTAKSERDEALEEANASQSAKNMLVEDKKKLEATLMHREEELEEAQTAREEAEDRYKRTLSLMEQAQIDLGLERLLVLTGADNAAHATAMHEKGILVSVKSVKFLFDRIDESGATVRPAHQVFIFSSGLCLRHKAGSAPT